MRLLILICYNLVVIILIGCDNMNLGTNNHSVFLLYYHLVLVVKYRRLVFDDTMSVFAKDIFLRISKLHNITLEQWNHDKDHVHIMFRAHPNTELSKFIKGRANEQGV